MAVENEEHVEETPSTNNKKAQIFVFGGIILLLIITSVASFMRATGGGTKVYEEQEQGLRTSRLPDEKQAELFKSRFSKAKDSNDRKGAPSDPEESYEDMIARLRAEFLQQEADTEKTYSLSPKTGSESNSGKSWQDLELDRVREARYDEYKLQLGFNKVKRKNVNGRLKTLTPLQGEIANIDNEILRAQALQRKYTSQKPTALPAFGFAQQGEIAGQTVSKSPNFRPLPGQKTLPIGTVIRAAIDQKVISDYTGSIRLQITHDVYDLERRNLLIPAGSICIAKSILISNVNEPIQSRVGYVVNKLRLPNGKVVDFSRQVALDHEGIAAVEGEVNRHLFAQFLGVAAYALLSNESSRSGSGSNNDSTYGGQVGENSREQFSPIAQKYLGLVPTVTLNPGHPVRIFIEEEVYITPWSSLGMKFDG